jgi:bifunctional DNA-binding transcriptional regulator/antitoxin component of YhaV-PrlF toxin-antitoxin module
MPLTEKVTFTTTLQSKKTVQIPKLIRWRFKLESNQALKVGVNFVDLHKGWQFFYAKMRKDGRVTVPKLLLNLFGDKETSLAAYVLEVMLEPA